MESLLFIIALVTSGIALMAGVNSVYVGGTRGGNRFELIFGIQGFLLFLYLVFPPTGFILRDSPPYPWTLDIKRSFIWAYYLIFPFFLEGYSGYRKKRFLGVITVLMAIGFVMSLNTVSGGEFPLWRSFVLVPLGLIGVYGSLAARHMYQGGHREWRWLTAAMGIYLFLYFLGAVVILGENTLVEKFGFYPFFLFHLNPLAFILIMSTRMKKDAIEKYRLEKLLRTRENRWDSLLSNIKLLAVELDRQGKVIYCNKYAIKCVGAATEEQLIGKDWFHNFMRASSGSRLRSVFNEAMKGGISDQELKYVVAGLDGREHNISWTSVLLPDESGNVDSLMMLGVDTTQLDLAINDLEQLKNELLKENVQLADSAVDGQATEIVGRSEAIVYAIQKAKQVANTHATVLLEGETGVGKELFADLIHQFGDRRNKPLIKVNCAALPSELIESELFGHEKGAFTGAVQARKGRFELADQGTIFLDEISELPLLLQPKLLRVLQSGEFERIGSQQTIKVDVRVISATNLNLMDEIREERFRKDLYYRLNVYPITIPSLRNRRSDIPLLVSHYIQKFAVELNKGIRHISRADLKRLEEYNWPGNIRELVNLIERSVITSTGDTLRIAWENHRDHLPESDRATSSLSNFEKDHILKVLKDTQWKINGPGGAAEKLGINPNTLRSRMKKLGIERNSLG